MTNNNKKSARLKKIEAMLTKLVQLRNKIFLNGTSAGELLSGHAELKLRKQYAILANKYGEIVESEIIEKLPIEIQDLKKNIPEAKFKAYFKDNKFDPVQPLHLSLNEIAIRYARRYTNPTHKSIIDAVLNHIKKLTLSIEIPGNTFTEIKSEGE